MTGRHDWRARRRRQEVRLEAERRRDTPLGPRGLPPAYDRGAAVERVFRVLGLYRRGARNALRPTVRRAELASPDLPAAFDGFTILFVSDLHLDLSEAVIAPAAELAAGLSCDLALFGGDYQSYGRPSAPQTAAAMAPLVRSIRARDGMAAVLGNHDRHDMVEALEGLGLRVLVNEHMVVHRGGDSLTVVGCDDIHCFHHPDAEAALRRAEGFRVALVHSPDFAPWAAAAGCAVYLAGHTHGGQVCLPGGRALVTALEGDRRRVRGIWRQGAMIGYTGAGLGSGNTAVRFNCPPEIALITLRRAQP